MVPSDQLLRAFERARHELLSRRDPSGHWIGELSSSALSTATAISALSVVERQARIAQRGRFSSQAEQIELNELIIRGLHWLAERQNPDGGWGDTDRSLSNIATTMLVEAAFHMTAVPVKYGPMLERAKAYIQAQGGITGLRRRYGRDKTFAVPILTNCALAGLVSWREVSALPFELACVPQRLYRLMRMPVVSYAIPALVAIGLARHHHLKPLNPIARFLRPRCIDKSLEVITHMQPESGGFLEATPLTSFVVMSLASTGRDQHPVTQRGVQFLLNSVRPDGSWPIDTNLATWNTTLAMNALAATGEDVGYMDCVDWLLKCQTRQVHPYTGAEPGGWGWNDLSGSVPDADDTPGALLALARVLEHDPPPIIAAEIDAAAAAGLEWLLKLQNRNGGWPTFCRGWGKLPFDRSASDLTAHALRAIRAWRSRLERGCLLPGPTRDDLLTRLRQAVFDGLEYLSQQQRSDGSWAPLWFGNQYDSKEENPVYGTSKVLYAYRDLDMMHSRPARRGLEWLLGHQNADGGWGGVPAKGDVHVTSSVEETSLAVEALLAVVASDQADAAWRRSLDRGLAWLVEAVESRRFREPSPIGFYFAKLWYYEDLYPITMTVSALGHAVARLVGRHDAEPQVPAEVSPDTLPATLIKRR